MINNYTSFTADVTHTRSLVIIHSSVGGGGRLHVRTWVNTAKYSTTHQNTEYSRAYQTTRESTPCRPRLNAGNTVSKGRTRGTQQNTGYIVEHGEAQKNILAKHWVHSSTLQNAAQYTAEDSKAQHVRNTYNIIYTAEHRKHRKITKVHMYTASTAQHTRTQGI